MEGGGRGKRGGKRQLFLVTYCNIVELQAFGQKSNLSPVAMGLLWEYCGIIIGVSGEYYGNIIGIIMRVLWDYYESIAGLLW